MTECTSRHPKALSRRAALAATGATALGLTSVRSTTAQGTDLASHPLTGTWLGMANPPLPDDPPVAGPALFGADGTVLLLFPVSQRGPQGPLFNSPYVGVWEPDSDRRGHFTAVQVLSGADGTFLGTITVDGFPEVSEDGQTLIDDGSRVTVTIRDAAGAITDQFLPTGQPEGRPVTGIRMSVGNPGFPESSGAATPTS